MWESGSLGYVSQYTLNALPDGMSYGTKYWWDVGVDTTSTGGGYCYSFDQNRTVTFSSGVAASPDIAKGSRSLHHEDMQR